MFFLTGVSSSAKMVLKKKKEVQVDAFFFDHRQLEKLQSKFFVYLFFLN